MNNKFRKKALDIIKQQNEKKTAGIEDVSQKVIDASGRLDSANKASVPIEKDYLDLAREYELKYGITLNDAMREIDRTYPEIRRAYIRKHNPHINFD